MVESTEATMASAPPPSKLSHNYNHPPYAEMILSAVKTLNEKNGSSRKAIFKFIDSAYSDLPSTHSALLNVHLRRLKEKGHLVMVKYSYKIPKQGKAPNSSAVPAKRGRGRPPKPNPFAVPQIGRGRPPKPAVLVGSATTPRGRPRKVEGGRPLKKAKVEGGDAATLTGRPRGRPKKVEGGNAAKMSGKSRGRPKKAEGGNATKTSGKPRGRPKKAEGGDGATVNGRPRGRAKKAGGGGGNPRGRPKKVGGGDATTASGRPRGKPKKVGGGDVTTTSGKPRGRPKKVGGGDVKTMSGRPRGRPKKLEL